MSIDFEDLELLLADLASVGAETPARAVRDRLMARVLDDHPPLALNRESGYATLLLDVAPGTRFPAHHHGGAEEC